MKITKVRTQLGEQHMPVSVELDDVVARMRSKTTKAAAETIAANALLGRLVTEKGGPHYPLGGTDRLPYLLFSATFGRNGFEQPRTFTQLLLLDIPCPEGARQVEEAKQRVAQVPYTLLAFAGVSGVTLKVVVRCAYADGQEPWNTSSPQSLEVRTSHYLTFLRQAQMTACELYRVLAQCSLTVGEPSLTQGCRMSHDPQLYYQPQAQALPVVRLSNNALAAYAGTRTDDDGTVIWYPDYSERKRLQMEFQTCLSKSIDDCATPEAEKLSIDEQAEHRLQVLADYCQKAGLPEESCTARALWTRHFQLLGADAIRKTFRTAYKKPYNGRPQSQMNEKERIIRFIEDFLSRRYQLRYNTVKGITEFRPNDLNFKQWAPLTDRQLKSLVVEEMKEGGESWMNDIRVYLESAHIQDYNPIHEFLAGVGEWDGKHNYIEDYARRLPTRYALWPKYFHRWFLAMVAQALDLNSDFGNSMVPMIIGEQGTQKTQFCNHILPPSMREYYMKDIKMDNAEQVERVLGRMWLVNIDEYDAKTPREQAKIKRLLTEKDVQVRKMRSDQYTMTPRLCSFIATTNDQTPLPAGDGTRRYLCVEVTGMVDMSGHIPYRQMYAQAVTELQQRDCIYWFTGDDEREIQEHNSQYQEESSVFSVLQGIFQPTSEHKRENLWQVKDIQKELARHLRTADIPSLKTLGLTLKQLHWERGGNNGIRGYYLKLK